MNTNKPKRSLEIIQEKRPSVWSQLKRDSIDLLFKEKNDRVRLIPKWARWLLLLIIIIWIFLAIFLPVFYALNARDTGESGHDKKLSVSANPGIEVVTVIKITDIALVNATAKTIRGVYYGVDLALVESEVKKIFEHEGRKLGVNTLAAFTHKQHKTTNTRRRIITLNVNLEFTKSITEPVTVQLMDQNSVSMITLLTNYLKKARLISLNSLLPTDMTIKLPKSIQKMPHKRYVIVRRSASHNDVTTTKSNNQSTEIMHETKNVTHNHNDPIHRDKSTDLINNQTKKERLHTTVIRHGVVDNGVWIY